MKELTKKVIILNNFTSPYVSQAIIFLKDFNPKLEGKAVEDAEMIVSRYIERMKKSEQPKRTVRKKGRWLKITIGSVLAAAILCATRYLIN